MAPGSSCLPLPWRTKELAQRGRGPQQKRGWFQLPKFFSLIRHPPSSWKLAFGTQSAKVSCSQSLHMKSLMGSSLLWQSFPWCALLSYALPKNSWDIANQQILCSWYISAHMFLTNNLILILHYMAMRVFLPLCKT